MKIRMAFGSMEEGVNDFHRSKNKQQAAALSRGRLLVIVATIC